MSEDSSNCQHEQDNQPVHGVRNQLPIKDGHVVLVPVVVFVDAVAGLLLDCFHLRTTPTMKNPIAAMSITVTQLVTFHARMFSFIADSPCQWPIGHQKVTFVL